MTRRLTLLIITAALLVASFLGWSHWHNRRRPRFYVSVTEGHRSLGLSGIVADSDGNLYVSARSHNQILKVTADGQVSVFAGNGHSGFGGDGGSARGATLSQPMGVALDREQNLFIADLGNNRIRRVDAHTGAIATVAGNGDMGGGTGKAAASSPLYEPVSVAVDGQGNFYIGGTTSLGIRRVDAMTGIVTKALGADLPGAPLAAEPAAGPFWVAAGPVGEVFYSDPSRNTVSLLDTATNETHAIAGSAECGFAGDSGPTMGSLLCFPEGLTLSGDRRLYIADTGNNRIRLVDLNTGSITTIAGNGRAEKSGDRGKAVDAGLNGPMGVAIDAQGNLYIADTGNNCIRKVAAGSGIITTWIGERDLWVAAAR